MDKKLSVIFILALMLSTSLVLAGTVEITVRMGDDYNALIRVKEGDTVLDTPKLTNYPMGLAELTYETGRSQADYLILVHFNGEVIDSYTLDNLDTGSRVKVDFRSGIPPTVTDLTEEQPADEEIIEDDQVDAQQEDETGQEPEETIGETGEDFSGMASTGRAIFYSNEGGVTVFSWILSGVIILVIVVIFFGKMKDRNKEEVEKYKDDLENIKKKIRKKIREIKVLKAKGIKLKKLIELEEGFIEEKKDLKNVKREVEEGDKKKENAP